MSMNLNKRQQDWFFPAQKQASEELYKTYENLPCNFQIFNGENRIIECFNGYKKDAKKHEVIEVHYVHMGHCTNVFIYKMEYVQGWHVDHKEKKG